MPPQEGDAAEPLDRSLREPLLPSSQQQQQDDDDKNVTIWTPSCCCWGGRSLSMNHNVFLNLVLCVTYGVSDSLWSGTVLAAYLKKMGHSQNSWVGNVEAANGLASLFSALPVGYLADKWGRSKVLRVGGVLLIVTAILHALLMHYLGVDETQEHPHSEWYLAGIMALWGIGGGIVMGPSEALFADSTPQGKRSQYYMYFFVCFQVASCCGPLVSILLFQVLGDDWDLYDLRIIIYVGLALESINGLLMMFFDDRKALEEPNQSQPEEGCEEDLEQPSTTTMQQHHKYRAWIPYILFTESLIFALGSGMTVKFFPLFFKDEVGMSPTQVQVVYFLVPLVMAGCSGIGQHVSNKVGLGRVPTALIFKVGGIFLLFTMVFFKGFLDARPLLLVPIYILRTALMNATYPLEESILMDNVPKQERGRWKSLESIAAVGWCGSAALGGWASDKANGDYTFTFLITACIQCLGTLFWMLLWPLVGKEEEGEPLERDPLQQPLLHQSSDLASNVGDEAFFDALAEPDDQPLSTSVVAAVTPRNLNTWQSKFPTLTETDCNRFQKMFVTDEEVLQKLGEYVQFRTLYKLDSMAPGTDDASDWKWASELAMATAKTYRGDLLPGVEGLAMNDRVCNLDQLPQLCFSHTMDDGSPVMSRDGHPIVHYLAGRLDNNNVSAEIHAVAIALYLEKKAQKFDLGAQRAILMVDSRKGSGWPNHNVLMVVGFLKILTKALHKIHPDRLAKLIIYPVPYAGVYAFKMMKGWLPKVVADNIILINGSDAITAPVPKDLSRYVAVDVLNKMEEVRRANFGA